MAYRYFNPAMQAGYQMDRVCNDAINEYLDSGRIGSVTVSDGCEALVPGAGDQPIPPELIAELSQLATAAQMLGNRLRELSVRIGDDRPPIDLHGDAVQDCLDCHLAAQDGGCLAILGRCSEHGGEG